MPIQASAQYSSKMSKNTLSPAGKNSRFMMSPFLKSIISNNLSATRYNNIRKHTSLMIDHRPGPVSQSDSADTDHMDLLTSPSEMNKYLNLHQSETMKFNAEFLTKHQNHAFCQSMKQRHVKRWNEDRTCLNFNSKNIHILIADDAVS